jgi:hypothetical protein
MLDKARLGSRYVCFTCGTKFYDMNRPVPTCPECSADQRDAPVRDIKALLSKGGGKRRAPEPEEADEEDLDDDLGNSDDDEDGEEEEEDIGLLGDDDDDDGGGEDIE